MEAIRTAPVPRLRLDPALARDFETGGQREWLVSNGLGGFAMGSVSGACTRRYHGLLVAALQPPVGRVLMLAKLEESVQADGRSFALSCNEYAGGFVHPRGGELLAEFHLDGRLPVWRWRLGAAQLEKRVWMEHGRNTTYVRYTLAGGATPLRLRLVPLCAWRDFHWHQRGPDEELWSAAEEDGAGVRVGRGARGYRVLASAGRFVPERHWYWRFWHRAEAARGLDAEEDLLAPGAFEVELAPGAALTLTASAEDGPLERDGAAAQARAQARQQAVLERSPLRGADEFVRRLVLAADQFWVRRGGGHSVLAGYPWFGDWGRDTMIALPGLALATGRQDLAAEVLETFAAQLRDGLLPNLFREDGSAAEYNTVDAALWFVEAVRAHVTAAPNSGLLPRLYPALGEIVAAHLRGTRYGIRVAQDGLLAAGEPGVQLTWMDAKVGDFVVTPRHGKPVEVNALWHHALRCLEAFARQLGDGREARRYAALAERAAEAFAARFWHADGGYLYDVIDGPQGDDATLRPNQIFAVSLPHSPLPAERQRAVVEAVGRHLLTPLGLRSLAPGHPDYRGRYGGGPAERDRAYHQGPVWTWLLGPYALAAARVTGDRAGARALLAGVAPHLLDHGLGSVSEIADGDPPHAPNGCSAQAWSVAEILRAWAALA